MRVTLLLMLSALPAWADDAPTQNAGVVALIVSQNPKHDPLAVGSPAPLKLGRYPAPGQPAETRLDLADPQNAGDYTLGSGVVIDARQGLILTTYSLIDGARKVYARGAAGGGSYADIHAADERAGLAVLRLLDPPPGLSEVPLFRGLTTPDARGVEPNILAGLSVTAIGHPAPANVTTGRPVVAAGRITEVGRRWPGLNDLTGSDGKMKPLGQFAVLVRSDIRATASCPGAAILNAAGELVALNAPAAGVSGPDAGGYAVPMDANFRRIVSALKAGVEVEYGFLGVSFDALRNFGRRLPELARGGVTLQGVMPGGPADRANLVGGRGAFGDTITAVDGTPLIDSDDLFLAVGAALAGSNVTLDVQSASGTRRRVTARLAKYPHDLVKLASVGPPSAFGVRVDYASVLTYSQSLPLVPPGVVAQYAADSGVAKKFAALVPTGTEPVRAWVVTAVDGRDISTPAEFGRLTANKPSVTLTVADAARPDVTFPLNLP